MRTGSRPDTSEGAAWISLVCLRIRRARALGMPLLADCAAATTTRFAAPRIERP